MKILYLTPNFANYSSAYYQLDFISALQKTNKVILWGPGYKIFNKKLNLDQIFNLLDLNEKDLICVGHGWLSDIPQNYIHKSKRYTWLNEIDRNKISELEFCAKYDFANHKGKKICFLNKEYVSLKKKLLFIKNGKFDLALSHYDKCNEFDKIAETKFKFFPCAVDETKFKFTKQKKIYDLFFSGLLQNPYIRKIDINSFNLRKKIQKELFYTLYNYPIKLNKVYKNKRIYWNAYTDNAIINKLLKLTNKYKKIAFSDYTKLFCSSKATLNTLSPYNLIGPRYFECMILGSINFCEESNHYNKLFEKYKHYVPFKKNLEDFKEKLNYATSDSKDLDIIRNVAYEKVMKEHTYGVRAKDFTYYAKNINDYK